MVVEGGSSYRDLEVVGGDGRGDCFLCHCWVTGGRIAELLFE